MTLALSRYASNCQLIRWLCNVFFVDYETYRPTFVYCILLTDELPLKKHIFTAESYFLHVAEAVRKFSRHLSMTPLPDERQLAQFVTFANLVLRYVGDVYLILSAPGYAVTPICYH